jgi:hypothetical protein
MQHDGLPSEWRKWHPRVNVRPHPEVTKKNTMSIRSDMDVETRHITRHEVFPQILLACCNKSRAV